MSSDNRHSYVAETRRIRARRLRALLHFAARRKNSEPAGKSADSPVKVSEAADPGSEPDEVIRHRLRQSGYDPDRWRNDPAVLMSRLMRPFAVIAATGLVVGLVLAIPGIANAAPDVLAAAGDKDALKPVIESLRVWLVILLGSIATLFLVVGALRLTAAGGDPGESEKGKSALKSAATGYALALLAPVIVTVIGGLFG